MATRRAAKAAEATAPAPSPAVTRRKTRQQAAEPAATMPPPEIKPIIPYPRRNVRRPTDAESIASVRSTHTNATATVYEMPTPGFHRLAALARGASTPGVRKRVSDAASVISTMTDSTPAMREARSGLMKSFFPRLSAATRDLQNHLEQQDAVDKEIWDTQLDFYYQAFDSYKQHYADSGMPYINGQEVLSRIGCPVNSPAWQRAMRIISTANLTDLQYSMVELNPEDRLSELQSLDSAFPSRFYPDESLDGDEYSFEQALEIRTQTFIATLQDVGENEDPYSLLARVFCDGEAASQDFKQALDDGPYEPLAAVDLNDDANSNLRGRYKTRLASIRSLLSPDANAQNVGQLQEHFRFDDFWVNLKEWIKACQAALQNPSSQEVASQASAAAQHDAPAPMDSQEDLESQVDSQLDSQNDSEIMSQPIVRAAPASSAQRIPWNQDSIKFLRSREQDLDQPEPASDRGSVVSDYPAFSNEAIIKRSQQHILDQQQQPSPQPTARTAVAAPSSSAAPVSGQKRFLDQTQAASQDDPFEDDDPFESDPRVPDSQKRGLMPPPPPSSIPNKRVRIEQRPAYDERQPSSSAAAARPRAKIPPPASSSYPPMSTGATAVAGADDDDDGDDEIDHEAVSSQAKAMTAVSRRRSGPQTRTPWSRNDTRTLIRAVHSFEAKWSKMQRAIDEGRLPFEHPRDQQGLRDKARLIKVDFLKTDTLLPPGFDLVVLGKKEIEAVKAVGKNPDRKEMDVDQIKRPVNTEYQPSQE